MDRKRLRLEEQAQSIEKTLAAKANSPSATLEATIKSAELYLQALKIAEVPSERSRLNAKCKSLLAQAEQLKRTADAAPISTPTRDPVRDLKAPTSARGLTTRENIILLEGSKLNGFVFKPWTGPPHPDEFNTQDGDALFIDTHPLPLSSEQAESFGGWQRPPWAPTSDNANDVDEAVADGTMMYLTETMDLVQDMTSDCSVVASLCAATSRAFCGYPELFRSMVYPFDDRIDRIIQSQSGKYILKLYFNGCWRRVEIDDFLPTSATTRVLHVIDRRHPWLLWPALIEKAYLKVRGGYDFPGSNSGTDLAVLTGWIPQQVFLHDDGVEPDSLWQEIVAHFRRGHALITIGTGKLPRREQKQLGLAAEHDYAILDLTSESGTKEMLIKNPWADGDIWRGATKRRPNPNAEDDPGLDSAAESMIPGTFWMDFHSVFHYFENMYINWNPALFRFRQDLHFSWQPQPSRQWSNILVDNPQFTVSTSGDGEVWLLLNRHFRTGDYTHATTGRNGYISLYLYHGDGTKVICSDGAQVRGPFVDSPNTLLRVTAAAHSTYTAVLATQDLPDGKLNFTLSVFANIGVVLKEASSKYTQRHRLESSWTKSTAGGNSDSPAYLSNPQFLLTLTATQKIAVVLRVTKQRGPKTESPAEIHVKLLVVFSDGSRIHHLRPRDTLAQSGDYRRGSTFLETELGKGQYSIICSTFDQGQHADFSLDLYSSAGAPAALRLLPPEASGRLSVKSRPALFGDNVDRVLAPITLLRMSRVTVVVRHEAEDSPAARSSLFKMTLEQGQGPYKRVVASSALDDDDQFKSVAQGLRMHNLDLDVSMSAPDAGGLWLVLERLAQGQSSGQGTRNEALQVEIYTDERLEIGPWGLGSG